MARPYKQTVDYFPHDAGACTGDTLTVLQSRFGNDGYAFWFKLLEKLASSEGHFLDCRNSTKWQLLLAKTGVNEITGVEIMKLLVEMQAIDKDLWESKVIWCQKLVDNLEMVYSNRRRELPKRPIITDDNTITTGKNCIICGKSILDMRADAKFCSNACRQKAYRVTDSCNAEIPQKPVITDKKAITTGGNPITTGGSTQSRVEYSKVDNIYIVLFNLWNELGIITHKKLTSDMKRAIDSARKDYSQEEVEQAMRNYAVIVKGAEYYFDHKWTLAEFLSRRKGNNIERFLNLEVAKSNFKKEAGHEAHQGHSRQFPKAGEYRSPEEIWPEDKE